MNRKQIFIIIMLSFLVYSCKYDSADYETFQFANYNMKIKIPKDFKSAKKAEIKKLYDLGNKKIKENGHESNSLQKNNILFLNKGEYSSIKIKYNPISPEIIKDYKNQWENLKKMTFNILKKEKMPESTIDSTSRIEKINGIDFYVFETNIKLLDLNNNKANFKYLRYSTPLEKLDFVVNLNYANKVDEEDILKTIESIGNDILV